MHVARTRLQVSQKLCKPRHLLLAQHDRLGGGMGQALNAASAMDAYTLSDRGSWLSFANKGSLVIGIENDPRLINRYDVIELNPRKHPDANLGAAKILAD